MTKPEPRTDTDTPIGRRVAELRVSRGMSQQVFADRVGRSKSWVDKVERGVRTLDRLSVIKTVAAALGVTPAILISGKAPQGPQAAADTRKAIERVREALARYDAPRPGTNTRPTPSARQRDDQVGYAWTAYRNGHHAQVLRMLPDLLGDAHLAGRPDDPAAADTPLRLYRLTAQVLVKLGEAHLAWLAADRAMTAAADDPRRAALATVSLTQALRALRRGHLARTAAVTATTRLHRTPARAFLPEEPALTGTLLLEAALAAAACGEAPAATALTDQAAHLATAHGHRHHGDHDGIDFGPTTVDLARALTAMRLGDHQHAITIHQYATSQDAWRTLPAEHRAAHLIDITRAHLDHGDHHTAGQALITADTIAPNETRTRPAARAALTAVLHAGPVTADVARLAATIGLTRK
ncbi:helix-turn-helix domain-containing protein [Micromonospora sp. DT233]|uniref:helix-turn-helix domain-containing protein n=1 Tax=Micromonospora sp. DT233 TaxID=3393432 RepID=UPI003CF36484